MAAPQPLIASDNVLFALLIGLLNKNLATWPFVAGVGQVAVAQKNQPTTEGTSSKPEIYIEKLFDQIYGSAELILEENPADPTNTLLESELQVYVTTFQVSAFFRQDNLTNIALPTASDLANVARTILQRRTSIRELSASGVHLIRVTEVKNIYFENEHDRQEAAPSFDIAMSYGRMIPQVEVGKVTEVKQTIHSVP